MRRVVFLHQLLFYIFLLFIPAQTNIFFWPSWSSVLGRKVDFLAPTIYATDILLLSVFALWFFEILHTKKQFTKRHILLAVLVFLLGALNSLSSLTPIQTIYGWSILVKMLLLICYVIHQNISFKKVFFVVFASYLWSSVLGILQIIHGGTLGSILFLLGERSFTESTPGVAIHTLCMLPYYYSTCTNVLRLYSTFPHPNVFAGWIVFATFLILYTKKRFDAHTSKPFTAFVFVTSLVLIILSGSRGAFVGIVVGFIWFFYNRYKKTALLLTIFCVVFSICITTPVFPAFSFLGESSAIRKELADSAFSIIKNHVWSGIGYRNFLYALPFYLVTRTVYYLQPVHNIYLLFLSEFGLIGVLSSVFLFLYSKKTLAVSFSRHFFTLLLPLLIIGLFDHYLLTLHQGLILFSLAVSFSLQKKR